MSAIFCVSTGNRARPTRCRPQPLDSCCQFILKGVCSDTTLKANLNGEGRNTSFWPALSFPLLMPTVAESCCSHHVSGCQGSMPN